MFTRYRLLTTASQHLMPYWRQQWTLSSTSTALVRKFSAENFSKEKSNSIGLGKGDDIFLDLTMDYNRRRSVRSELMSSAIKQIDGSISERLSLLVLTAAARCVHNVTPERRVELLEEIWKRLHDSKIRLTTRHYETYLSGLNENGFIFDADYYLKLIDKEQIQPTPRLYSLLLTQYCREGNTDRAQNFLKMLKERNVSIDEDIFSALIVCQLKLGNEKGANDIIHIMKERGLQPTISTYKEILTALISEHKANLFETYFMHIESQQNQSAPKSSSTLYVDAGFVIILLSQCISYKERAIFNFLLNKLKHLDYQRMPNNIFNLAMQCLSNEWHESIIELLKLETNEQVNNEKPSPHQAIHGRQWVLFFKYLFDQKEFNLIDTYLDLMMKNKLIPLDPILRVFYSASTDDFRPALNYIERGQQMRHPMRTNYFYPLLTNAYIPETSNKWTDADRIRLFRLLDRLAIPIESSTYSRLLQEPFYNFYQKNFQPLLDTLAKEKLTSILDRICRLLLADIQRRTAPVSIVEQIVPHFRLSRVTRQEELGKILFSVITDVANSSTDSNSENEPAANASSNLDSIYQLIDRLSGIVTEENPMLKRDLYVQLLRNSAQNNRHDLTKLIAEKCAQENIKISGSVNEINALTGISLSPELVEKLARYKPGELSWKEKLNSIDLSKANRKQLEQIYDEAKQDGRTPIDIQRRLLEVYSQSKLTAKAMEIFKEISGNRPEINPSILHRLLDLTTISLKDKDFSSKSEFRDHVKQLREFYEKFYNIVQLPSGLIFRLAHTDLLNGDEEQAIKIISTKVNNDMNEKVYDDIIKLLQTDSSLLSIDGLNKISRLFIGFRITEPIRKFWSLFFDILLEKTSSQDLVQFYSDAMRENSNVPYGHLLQLFIEKDELNCLQDIVDIATLQHGSSNVLHDLGFALIKAKKLKHAEKIFKTSWLKARNDRINLHANLFSEANNIDALIDSINLTKDLPDVKHQQLFSSALRVAVRLERSDVIDWLIQKVREHHIQLDSRVKKYIDAHLRSKGLDPLNVIEYDETRASLSNKEDSDKESRQMHVQN